jgi:DHA1 family bicyclomycin/chloramphenicol resistance-like MFS transporter
MSRGAYLRLAILLGGLSALGPLAIDMYLPSFPAISRELSASPSAVQLTVALYFVGLAIGQAFYGPLSDRFGRRRPLLVGLLLFIMGSIGCAYAHNVAALIGLRLIQALGGCAAMVITRAVVRDLFDARDSMHILSLLMLVMGVAPILAPLVGGQLLIHFGWRAVFWVIAAGGALGFVAVQALLPDSLHDDHRTRHTPGEVVRIYGTLMRDRAYMAQVLAGGLSIAGMFAYIAGSPFVFIDLYHVPAERFGLFFGSNALGLITASQINGRLSRRTTPAAVLRVVIPVAMAASLVLLVATVTGRGGFPGIVVPLFVFVSSLGFILPNTTVLAMDHHGRVAGSASALYGVFQFGLGAVAGGLVGLLNNGTALPLGAVIALCGVTAFIAHAAAPRPRAAHGNRSVVGF